MQNSQQEVSQVSRKEVPRVIVQGSLPQTLGVGVLFQTGDIT